MNVVLPALDRLLDDKNPDILKAACQATVTLASILTPEDSASFLLTSMLRTLHDEEEEIRIRALITLKDLIEHISPDMCECFVVKEAMLLSSETIVKVRKAVAEMVPKIIKNLQSSSGVQKVLPIFQSLSKDSIWGVRKSCVEYLPDIMESLDQTTQQATLLPLFEDLLNDKSNSVRLCALGRLGPMIHSCKGPVPDVLLSAYLELSKNSSNKGELQYHCAFYFPAVLLKLGPGSWGDLSSSYNFLAAEGDLKCKKCLLSGMHEIGKILGAEVATAELVPVFEKVYNESASTKQIAAGYIGKLLPVLIPSSRLTFLKYVKTMYKVSANWRIRLNIAEQLSDFLPMFDAELVYSELAPVVFALADDRYSKVRETAAAGVASLVNMFVPSKFEKEIIASFKTFSQKSYQTKQIFLLTCEMLPASKVVNFFSEEFLQLSEGSANLKMICGRTLRKYREQGENIQFLKVLEEKLSRDFDADVRFEVTGKFNVERGPAKLRPNSKKICELMEPMLRALFPDDDLEEIIQFRGSSEKSFYMIRSAIIPAMNGFVEELSLDKVNKNKLLIDV
jgi:serine/threonine-protein phosphatase 4 regulatory subunit 1